MQYITVSMHRVFLMGLICKKKKAAKKTTTILSFCSVAHLKYILSCNGLFRHVLEERFVCVDPNMFFITMTH